MIRHNVLLKFSDDMTLEDRSALLAALDQLPSAIPEIVDYHFGFDLDLDPGNQSMSIVAVFRDVEGYEIYRDHPDHLALIATYIKPFVTGRTAAQVDHPSTVGNSPT